MTQLIKAEFHCHSIYSPDSLFKISSILETCREKGIDKIAITDHDQVHGALEAKSKDPERVIVGEEIQTTEGEILAYFISDLVPGGLSPMKTIEALKKQSAFISIAHPFDPMRGSTWQKGTLEVLLPFIDAIEVFNARCVKPAFNERADEFAEAHQLLRMVGSDAHSAVELGRAVLQLPDFKNADELRSALGAASFDGKLSGSWVHLISRYAKFAKQIRGSVLK